MVILREKKEPDLHQALIFFIGYPVYLSHFLLFQTCSNSIKKGMHPVEIHPFSKICCNNLLVAQVHALFLIQGSEIWIAQVFYKADRFTC